MPYIGIDVGSKKSGIAISDESHTIANPHSVIETNNLIEKVKEMFAYKTYKGVVLGLSQDLKGNDNPIMKKILSIKKELEGKGINTHLHSEIYSTQEAKRIGAGRDDEAAAIILQSFLDKQKNDIV